MTLQVGVLGGFQHGKSTLINCLLEDRVAISGKGNSTTKQVVKYFYSERTCVKIHKGDKIKTVPISNFSRIALDENVLFCEFGIPCPFLKQIELWDTPGFDAKDRDDKVTTDCLEKLDCAIFLLGGYKGGLSESEKSILKLISEKRLPYVVVFNSQSFSDEQWIPYSEKNWSLCQATSAEIKMQYSSGAIAISTDLVLPINAAWFWYNFVKKNKQKKMLLDATEGEDSLCRKVSIFLYGHEEINQDKIAMYSNIGLLKNFLSQDSICFGNIHTVAQIYKALDDFKRVLKNSFSGEDK